MGISAVNTKAFEPSARAQHYSQAIKAGGFLFSSGIVGVSPDGSLPENLETEFRKLEVSVIAKLK